jgi:hypothetical protein
VVDVTTALIRYKSSSEERVQLEFVRLQIVQNSTSPLQNYLSTLTHILANSASTKTPYSKLRMKFTTTFLLSVLAALTTGVIAAPVASTEGLEAIAMRAPHETADALGERAAPAPCKASQKRSPWSDDWGCDEA